MKHKPITDTHKIRESKYTTVKIIYSKRMTEERNEGTKEIQNSQTQLTKWQV